ncbi:MAG: hypothetical protein LGR52_11825, partial [Candidatus Thiosymbion ectosymbiont of Robbea hypermnestra]|nr:hypothetical protein [Candidatus Thiosymbion ectosymbiont of Robbea hypermnestra]
PLPPGEGRGEGDQTGERKSQPKSHPVGMVGTPSPARGEGLLAVASLVGPGLTWTARHDLNF